MLIFLEVFFTDFLGCCFPGVFLGVFLGLFARFILSKIFCNLSTFLGWSSELFLSLRFTELKWGLPPSLLLVLKLHYLPNLTWFGEIHPLVFQYSGLLTNCLPKSTFCGEIHTLVVGYFHLLSLVGKYILHIFIFSSYSILSLALVIQMGNFLLGFFSTILGVIFRVFSQILLFDKVSFSLLVVFPTFSAPIFAFSVSGVVF